MQKFLLLSLMCSFAFSEPLSKRGSDIVPFGSDAKVCNIAFSNIAQASIPKGDVAIIRVDMSHLQTDKKLTPEEIRDLNMYHSSLYGSFERGGAKVLSTQTVVHGPDNEKIDFVYFVKPESVGKTEFSTQKNYQVVTGQQEMGASELSFLRFITDFKKQLVAEGSAMMSFSDYMLAKMPNASDFIKPIIAEMGQGEEKKPWEERLALADARIAGWRKSLAPPIYGNHRVYGNILPIEITQAKRSGVEETEIHQLPYRKLPSSLEVKVGDIIAVEALRPKEIVGNNYSHKYDIPHVTAKGLTFLYNEAIEEALLGNDHGTNISKTYFLVSSTDPAMIEIENPRIGHPYTPNQKPGISKRIAIKVQQPEAHTGSVAVPKPVQELQPSILAVKELPAGSVLGKADLKAMQDFATEIQGGKTVSVAKKQALAQVLRPFLGDTEGERLFFLKQTGMDKAEIAELERTVDFKSSNDQFFPTLITELQKDNGLSKVTDHLLNLRLD